MRKLIFIGERDLTNVVNGTDIAGLDAGLVKLFPVCRYVFIDALHAVRQFRALKRTHFLAGHRLAFFIQYILFDSSNLNL